MSFAIATPYLIPKDWAHKRSNVGDGIIRQSILDWLKPHRCRITLSSRVAPTRQQIGEINRSRALILAGANLLTDHFSAFPGMSVADLESIKVPIVPFGIGIHGDGSQNLRMSESTASVLRFVHSRIRFSSWRCPGTLRYLEASLPDLSRSFLMTGCPSMYDPKAMPSPEKKDIKNVVVTVTDRGDFWERETKTIDLAASKFGSQKIYLSWHQGFGREEPSMRLRRYAEKKGLQMFVPKNVRHCTEVYERMDAHIGSRLHAHLYFLRRGKRSFLVPVDQRSAGFSEAFGFPLCDLEDPAKCFSYDFRGYYLKLEQHRRTLTRFLDDLKDRIL